MSKLRANYHTHTELCNHAVGDTAAYIKKAIELGMEEIGISDHDPIPCRFMTKDEYKRNLCYRNMSLDAFYNVYLKELDEAFKLYGNQIKIYKGLECEYISGEDSYFSELKSHLDYLNLGVHFFKDSNGRVLSSYNEIYSYNLNEYVKTAIEGMSTGLFKVLVHPDLFMFNYKNKDLKREFDEEAIKATRQIVEAAIKYNVYLEVNVNGLANSRKYNSSNWLYPYYDFWKIVSEYKDAKIIIGVDAHSPLALDNEDLDMVIQFCKDLKLNISDKIEW